MAARFGACSRAASATSPGMIAPHTQAIQTSWNSRPLTTLPVAGHPPCAALFFGRDRLASDGKKAGTRSTYSA